MAGCTCAPCTETTYHARSPSKYEPSTPAHQTCTCRRLARCRRAGCTCAPCPEATCTVRSLSKYEATMSTEQPSTKSSSGVSSWTGTMTQGCKRQRLLDSIERLEMAEAPGSRRRRAVAVPGEYWERGSGYVSSSSASSEATIAGTHPRGGPRYTSTGHPEGKRRRKRTAGTLCKVSPPRWGATGGGCPGPEDSEASPKTEAAKETGAGSVAWAASVAIAVSGVSGEGLGESSASSLSCTR
mmetsp:Transcript_100639/g.267505  ORF Transcript_100639/g.267505 Transcript_100639/m.267505 type:complete len:241 (-) Transcript_100639:1868-2590(-)